MKLRGLVIATGALATLTLPLAYPAGAAPPQRGCAPPFDLLTRDDQVRLAMSKLGISEAAAIALVDETAALVDRNGDTLLCYVFPNPDGPPNVIDNTSRAGPRLIP